MEGKQRMEVASESVPHVARLFPDKHTMEYIGTGNPELDAACCSTKQSIRALYPTPTLGMLDGTVPIAYYEVLILATGASLGAGADRQWRSDVAQGVRQIFESAASSASWRLTYASRMPSTLEAPQAMDEEPTDTSAAGSYEASNGRESSNGTTAVGNGDHRGSTTATSTSYRSSLHFAFALSSQTLAQIRARHLDRLERTHEAESGAHARQHSTRKLARRQFGHCVRIGLLWRNTTSHEEQSRVRELGELPNAIGYVGKHGRIVSNGKEIGQGERFQVNDVVGCGLLLDTRIVFFTKNGDLVGFLPLQDIHHLMDEMDHGDSCVGPSNSSTNPSRCRAFSWMDSVYPAVSLHGVGEAVSFVFEPAKFRFNLKQFSLTIKRERCEALSLYSIKHHKRTSNDGQGSLRKRGTIADEDSEMIRLLKEYFLVHGYRECFHAASEQFGHLDGHNANLPAKEIMSDMEKSLDLRKSVQSLIMNFRTEDAVAMIDEHFPAFFEASKNHEFARFECDILSVVDDLQVGPQKPNECGEWNTKSAIKKAWVRFTSQRPCQRIPHQLRSFLAVLLFDSLESIPRLHPGRQFVLPLFREQIAGKLNRLLVDHVSDLRCATTVSTGSILNENTIGKSSAFEHLLGQIEAQQDQVLCRGLSAYPLEELAGLDGCVTTARRFMSARPLPEAEAQISSPSSSDSRSNASGNEDEEDDQVNAV